MANQNNEDLIPLEKVLDDMYNESGTVASGARSYYYMHYASKEQRSIMDREDKIDNILAIVLIGLPTLIVIITTIILILLRI